MAEGRIIVYAVFDVSRGKALVGIFSTADRADVYAAVYARRECGADVIVETMTLDAPYA